MSDAPAPNKSLKKHRIATGILLVIVGAIGLILLKGLYLNPQQIHSALINKPAPGFEVLELQNAAGQEAQQSNLSLDTYVGRPVVLNFWASWCVSCREEARYFEDFWKKYKDAGVVVLGIAIQDERDASLAFAKQYGKTYLLGLDTSGRTSINYGVTGVPETFFIDRGGIVRHREVGPMSVSLLESKLSLIQ